jgi:hypothetical protein
MGPGLQDEHSICCVTSLEADKANPDIFEENMLRAILGYCCDLFTTFHRIAGPEIFSLEKPTKTGVPDAHIEPEDVFGFGCYARAF